jgi:hypothetical protein
MLLQTALRIKNAYTLPTLDKGDILLGGKYRNVPMEVEGMGRDENNQPTIKTNKGERSAFAFRVKKLMDKK